MKNKIIVSIFVVVFVVLAAVAIAGEVVKLPNSSGNALPFIQPFALATNQTTTGASTNYYNFGYPMKYVTCNAVYSGVTPTSIELTVQGSIDGTYWIDLATNATVSATSGAVFSSPTATGLIWNRLRSNIVTISTGSDGNSKTTVNCMASH